MRKFVAPAVLAGLLALAGCSSAPQITTVTVVTHDSWAMPDDLIAKFEADTGYHLEFVAPGDAGTLVNQLVLTKDAPLGDVVYGVDNTYGSRAVDAGVFADFNPGNADADAYACPNAARALTAVDFSDVCVNADVGWFEEHGIPIPRTFEDLAQPTYKGLLSVENPGTSSPGLAFLLGTIDHFGDAWPDYWADLAANGVRVTSSWSDTYFTDFSAPNYGGDYPLVVSYASSPPSEVIDGSPTTVALLGTCYRQVEYAGVLAGAHNKPGAEAVIRWLLSDDVQAALPDAMYVYPVSTSVTVPDSWAKYAPLSQTPGILPPATVSANRADYIAKWTQTVLG